MTDFKPTPEQEAQIEPWQRKWMDNAFRTGKLSKKEKEGVTDAVVRLYANHSLPAPVIVFSKSPYSAACAFGICEAIVDAQKFDAEGWATAVEVANERVRLATTRILLQDPNAKPIDLPEQEGIIEHVLDLVKSIVFSGKVPRGVKQAKVIDSLGKKMRECIRTAHDAANAGNQASAWVAHVTYFRYVVKYEADYSRWDAYEKCAVAGPRFMHEDFCIVSDILETLKLDAQDRPHCEDGPALAWSDGWRIYAWHQTRIPYNWIEDKASLDPMTAITWRNIEQRRCASEILGWERILREIKHDVVDADPNPQIGTLIRADIPDAGIRQFLRVLCGTGRTFAIPVHERFKTALEANAATYNLRPEELRKMEFRT